MKMSLHYLCLLAVIGMCKFLVVNDIPVIILSVLQMLLWCVAEKDVPDHGPLSPAQDGAPGL